MPTINLAINVDDETSQKIINDGLEALQKEDFQEIVKNAISNYFSETKNLEQILLQPGNFYGAKNLAPKFENMLRNVDLSDCVTEFKSSVTKMLKDNTFVGNLVERLLLRLISEKLAESASYTIRELIQQEIISYNNTQN